MVRVCILTAGIGSRLEKLTKNLNKSLVTIACRPVLSHIIEKFPLDTEFVIALGYKGSLVRDFLEIAYPDRIFIFEEVKPFEGEGSGLGLSLLSCKEHLRQPFIFNSCDTLVSEEVPLPSSNWLGYSKEKDLKHYRTIAIENGFVTGLFEKSTSLKKDRVAYIGLAGISDYHLFWEAMEKSSKSAIETGEAFGLKAMLDNKITIFGKSFTWFDTGNLPSLEIARKKYDNDNLPNILEKENEAIWFVDNKVIKFNVDKKFISNRVQRAKKLNSFVPKISAVRPNMYAYKKIEGPVLSDVLTKPLFKKFLDFSLDFWKPIQLNKEKKIVFNADCKRFYRDKTFYRINLFYQNFEKKDINNQIINGIKVPKLESQLGKLDWDWLADGKPVRYHGDFHFENILVKNKSFVFLDWRQDFAGHISVGDLYYDLAKLLHGIIVNHGIITKNHYSVNWASNKIDFDLYRTQILVECERLFYCWIRKSNFDIKKVKIITGLIFLNIACLHHFPYALLLFALGRLLLNEEVQDQKWI